MRWCAGLALGLAVQPALAETPRDTPTAIEVDREAAPPGRAELGFDAGAPVEGWAASVMLGWLERPITLRTVDTESSPVIRRMTLGLGAAVALGDAAVIDARLPLARQTGDRLAILGEPRTLDPWVPGDLRLGGRVRVVGNEHRAAFVRAELTLPTGDDRDFAGESSWTLAWTLIARLTLPGSVVIAGAGGIRFRGDEVRIVDRVVGDELHGNLGVSAPLGSDDVRLTGEVAGILGDNVAGKRGPSPAEVRIGLVTRPTSTMTLGIRIGVGLGDQIGAPSRRATFELTYRGTARLIPRASPEGAGEASDGE